jgi:hypothetical protein
MSATILSGDWTIYYLDENRQKRLEYSGSGTTYTVNELYSALQDHFDELTQLDDGTPMSAQTPTEYTIGIIDSGDNDPWFIDKTSVEYLTGGAIKTASWLRAETTNTGIIKLTVNNTNIVSGDIGYDIVGDTDSDTGTLLDVYGTGTGSELWVRPDSSAAANSFDNSTQGLTCNTHTATQEEAPESGEMLWANIYSLGTIASNSHLYVNQEEVLITAFKDTTDWWDDGHIDILLLVKEVGSNIDDAVVTVMARRYGAAYDYYEVDLSAGGRNPIPLATGADLDNTTGYKQVTFSGASGGTEYTVGDVIYVAASAKEAVITGGVDLDQASGTFYYYLIGDPLTDFSNSDTVTDGTRSCTVGTPADYGPATLSGLSITHTARDTDDINEDGSTEPFSIAIDCSDEVLTDVWEWLKYITMRGETGTSDTDTQSAEFYVGTQYQVEYTGQSGSFSEGETLWLHDVSNVLVAYGVVVADHDDGATGDLLLRSVRLYGSMGDVTQIGDNVAQASYTDYATVGSVRTITPTKQSPFGTFAGGTFFGAPGVVLLNYDSGDINSFQLIDDDGTIVTAPIKVSVAVTNTRAGDNIAVFRLDTNDDVEKDTYLANASQTAGATSLVVSTAIGNETPGKTTGGIVRIVDVSVPQEYRLRYTSWDTSTFTLFNMTSLTADGSNCTSTQLTDTGANFQTNLVKVGDLIRNTTEGAIAYVTAVVSENELTTTPVTDWTSDAYEIGTLPITTTAADDTVYVPFIDVYEDTGTDGSPGSESVNVTYEGDIDVRVRVRQAGDIVPFEADNQIKSTGMSQATIRTPDTIYTA